MTALWFGRTIVFVSVFLMLCWYAGYDSILTLGGQFVTVKFLTAAFALMSGVMVLVMRRDAAGSSMVAFSFGLIIVTSQLIINGENGKLPFADSDDLFHTLSPGLPSVGTCLGYFMAGVFGVLYYFHNGISYAVTRAMAVLIAVLGALALVGYAADIPLLYWLMPDVSSAMSPITAVLLILLSVGLYDLSQDK